MESSLVEQIRTALKAIQAGNAYNVFPDTLVPAQKALPIQYTQEEFLSCLHYWLVHTTR
jgi:hypothetical protein